MPLDVQAALDAVIRKQFGTAADPGAAPGGSRSAGVGAPVAGQSTSPGPNLNPGLIDPTFAADPRVGGAFNPDINNPPGREIAAPDDGKGFRTPGFGNSPAPGGGNLNAGNSLLRNTPPKQGFNQRKFGQSGISNFLRNNVNVGKQFGRVQ